MRLTIYITTDVPKLGSQKSSVTGW